MLTEMQKYEKRPPKSSKNKMVIFGLRSTSDDRPSNLSNERRLKCKETKKGPLRHWKIKCLILDYVQLLMMAKWSEQWTSTKTQKKKKNEESPPKSSKNKMFVFGLHSTSDDWLSNLSNEIWSKCEKMKKLDLKTRWYIGCGKYYSMQTIKYYDYTETGLHMDYVQLLMIGRVIWAMNVNQNSKKWKQAP